MRNSAFLGLLVTWTIVVALAQVPSDVPASTDSTSEKCSKGTDCDTCVKIDEKCLWCNSKNSCLAWDGILPSASTCPLKEAKWGQCWVNYEALLITMGVLGGLIIILSCCCVYCCCCRNSNKGVRKQIEKEERRYAAESQEREQRHAARREERKGRLDEIRKKYGLIKDDQPYERFDE